MDTSKISVGDLMTIDEATKELDVSRQSIYNAISRGALTPVEVFGRQRLLREEVATYRPQGYKGKRPSKREAPAPSA